MNAHKDVTTTNSKNVSQQSGIDNLSIEKSESNRTLNISSSSCISKQQQQIDIRQRPKKFQEKKLPREYKLRHSISSYKTHFSPQPSIRIKIIDETDTDNDLFV